MADERLIVGIYLDPHMWLSNKGEKITSLISRQECLEIVFSKKLPNGVEVCAQRQGFVVAAIPKDLMGDPTMVLNSSNLLPGNAAPFVNDLFNAFLYMFYEQLCRNKTFYGIKPAIDNGDLWRWLDKPGVDLTAIAIKQPGPILNQHALISPDNVFSLLGKTVGQLSDHDKMSRMTHSVLLLDAAFDAMHVDDYLLNYQLMALLNKAVLATQRGEFAQAHIFSWAVAEKFLQIRWDEHLIAINQFSNSKSGVSVAKQINDLKDAKIIPAPLYDKLDAARDVRNKWMHNLEPINLDECRNCYLAARDLLSAKINFAIEHPGGYYLFEENI